MILRHLRPNAALRLTLVVLCQVALLGCGDKSVPMPREIVDLSPVITPDINIQRLGTRAQMNPPVRGASHRDAIWRGLDQGVVDVLGSDHAPHTAAEKAKSYPASPSGMTGVQTLVPIMLDHVHAGRLSLARLVDLTSAGPARLFGIACKGRIACGYDADLTIVDLKRRQTITNQWIASRAGWTPYDGVVVTGWPAGTPNTNACLLMV
jgi:dihydroorotase